MEYFDHFQSLYKYVELYGRKYANAVYEFLLFDNKSYTDDYYHVVYYFYTKKFDPYGNCGSYCFDSDFEEYQPESDHNISESSNESTDCTLSLIVYEYIVQYTSKRYTDYRLQIMCVNGNTIEDAEMHKNGYYIADIYNNFIIVEFYKES